MNEPASVVLDVNGVEHAIEVPCGASLLHVLRNDLGLNGPKYGCGLGQCGACTVLIDGKAARSCVLRAGTFAGHKIVTLEGLADEDRLHPVQISFIAENATQCGYCLNGMILTIVAFLDINAHPSEQEIKEALRYNLCRCGSHVDVLRAVRAAVMRLAESP